MESMQTALIKKLSLKCYPKLMLSKKELIGTYISRPNLIPYHLSRVPDDFSLMTSHLPHITSVITYIKATL